MLVKVGGCVRVHGSHGYRVKNDVEKWSYFATFYDLMIPNTFF